MTDLPGLDSFGRFANRAEVAALHAKLEPGEAVGHAVACTAARKGLLVATDRRILWLAEGALQVRTTSWPYRDVRRVTVEVARDGATITLACADGDHAFRDAERQGARAFAAHVDSLPHVKGFRPVEPVTREASREWPDAERHLAGASGPGGAAHAARVPPRTATATGAGPPAGTGPSPARTEPAPPGTSPSPPAPTARERLDRLDRMRTRGSLTEPEYQANRRRILEAAGDADGVRPPRPAGRLAPDERGAGR